MSSKDTVTSLLDASERLFAHHGIAATSLRAITVEAEVNLASVHYHFGSKDALVSAVFARRLEPLNRKRLKLLRACGSGDSVTGEADDPLVAAVRALVGPTLRLRHDPNRGGEAFMRLMGRLFSEPESAHKLAIIEQFREVNESFTRILGRLLPRVPKQELEWRKHFAIGAMAHTASASDIVALASGGMCDPSDVEATITRLTGFIVAGLRAPSGKGVDPAPAAVAEA